MDKSQVDRKSIGSIVDAKIKDSLQWYNSRLSLEREKVTLYYNSERPLRQKEASSSYISNDVYDSVESMKAQLLETFASGFEIVKFDPQNQNDIEGSRIATQYCDYVMFRQNNGYQIFHDTIHDGLTARVGIAKVYWDEKVKFEDEEFENYTQDDVNALVSLSEVDAVEASLDESTGLFKGKLTRKIDQSQVRVVVVPPEEFCIESQAKHLGPEYFCCHRTLKTVAELEEEGYDKAKLADYEIEDDTNLQMMPELLARFNQVDDGIKMKPDSVQDELRWVLVHECYVTAVLKGDNHARLYKVLRCGKITLDMEEVEDLPFVPFVPLPFSHSFYGNSFAAKVISTQNVRTVLTRSIIDHAMITNNPRYQVLQGALTNPRELFDNRLGGIVNTTRPDAVTPLQQASLNPFVYQTLELIKAANEETTGISSLSQGLNKDAISSQNSQGLVNDLVNMSQTRQKVIARNFANNFLIPLYLKIYQIVLAKEKRSNIVELAGNWVQIDPRQWAERKTATVSFHLGYGEQDREAMKRIQLGAAILQDPQSAQFFQPQGRYKYIADIFKLKGISNVNDYLTPPNMLPPQKPNPMMIQNLQNETTKAQAAMLTAQSASKKIDTHSEIEQLKLSLAETKAQFDRIIKLREEKRKDTDIANKVDISQREIHMAETTPQADSKTVIAPHG